MRNTQRGDGDVGDSELIGNSRVGSKRASWEEDNEDQTKQRENRASKESHIKLETNDKFSRDLSTMFASLHLSKPKRNIWIEIIDKEWEDVYPSGREDNLRFSFLG